MSAPHTMTRRKRKKRKIDELNIEGSDLVAHIMNLSMFSVDDYVDGILNRLLPLMDRVLSLNQIFDLLEHERLPIRLGHRIFSRYDWIRLTLDTLQVRFTSVRDSALLVAAAVFEIREDPRNIRISKIKAIRGTKQICQSLERIGLVGSKIRAARDRNFHRAEDPLPYEDPAFFQFLAKAETSSRWRTAKLEADLAPIHKQVLAEIQLDFEREAPKLVKELHRLLKRLEPPFEKRFRQKQLDQ